MNARQWGVGALGLILAAGLVAVAVKAATRGPVAPTAQPPPALLERATAQVSKDSGVAAAITLVSATAVDWPDGGLGCPEPGVSYIQMVTPGYWLVFAAGTGRYEIHTGTDAASRVASCGAIPASP